MPGIAVHPRCASNLNCAAQLRRFSCAGALWGILGHRPEMVFQNWATMGNSGQCQITRCIQFSKSSITDRRKQVGDAFHMYRGCCAPDARRAQLSAGFLNNYFERHDWSEEDRIGSAPAKMLPPHL
jgi:hypothetical protein